MALTSIELELHALIKLKKAQIALLRNGVRIEAVAQSSIDDLLKQGVSQRFKLSRRFLLSA